MRAHPNVALFAPPRWSELLMNAVRAPGVIAAGYRRFWSYSPGNQLLALFQCTLRKIEPGPINTFVGWRKLGRTVKRGEKALVLCMPVTCKRKNREPPSEDEDSKTFSRFVYRPHWFVLSQTDGEPYESPALPDWSETRALRVVRPIA